MVSPQQFSSYLRKPYDLDATAEADLRSIVQQYPYFSNAHLLLARSLHNQKSPAFDDALKQASMFAGERPLLYKLVNIEEKEAAPIERTFNTVAPAPTPVEESQPIEAVKEDTLAADSYKETQQTATSEPQIEIVEDVAAPETETVTDTTEHTDFELPVVIEEHTDVTENEVEKVEIPIEEPFEETENTYAPPTEAKPLLNEEDKVKSAYEEIFGSTNTTEEDITTDFENFDDDDDFVLHIDDNDSADIITEDTIAKTTEEDFEAEIGDRLDNDGDGIIAPANTENTPEEEFELDVADAIANTQPEQETIAKTTEEGFEAEIGDRLDNDGDGIIAPANTESTPEEEFEIDVADGVANTQPEQETVAETTEEDFEAEIGDRLDNDGDGIIAPANTESTPEEEFEIDVADAIANTQPEQSKVEETLEDDITVPETTQHQSDDEFEIGDILGEDNIIIPVPDEDAEEEDFELDLTSIANAESEQDEDIVKMMEQSIDEAEEQPAFETFEESTLEEPIAFKLEPKTDTEKPNEIPVEEESAQKEPIVAAEEEKTTIESESVLLHHDTFFEWLGQLQKLQTHSTDSTPDEKKNKATQQPQTVEKTEPTATIPAETQTIEAAPQPIAPVASTTPKRTTVDEIINRFISINPTISRPKAEFYNPTAKSKESDTERDDLATETLAKIYSDQQLNEKAVDVYQRLIKRFPHKTEQYKAAIAELEGGN